MKLRAIGAAAFAALAGSAAAPAHAEPSQTLPTPDQVSRVLTDLANPETPDQAKNGLVQGGIGSAERRAFNHNRLKKSADHGELPLSFDVGNIWPVGPGTAAAQVSLSGPKLAPTTKVFTFVDQSGWVLSSDSAAALISTVARD